MSSCVESFGNKIDGAIGSFFRTIGLWVGGRPRKTLLGCVLLTVLCGVGFLRWETENRPEELWVPQNTRAEEETAMYQKYFASESRFNSIIVQSASSSTDSAGANVLTKDALVEAMTMHKVIETKQASVKDKKYDFLDICTNSGGACASTFGGVCQCLVTSILKQWNYDLDTLKNDSDVLATINSYGSKADLEAVLAKPVFDDTGAVVSAEAFTLSYFIQDQATVVDGSLEDPISDAWEKHVFLETVESEDYPALQLNYLAGRSFSDVFGGAITSDLMLVNISYAAAFLFLGATMGKIMCGTGSRWTLALGALFTVGLSTAAGFGLSSACGLFFGPVHSLLPFILLGIGVDDAFIIVNAFNRERKVSRASESNDDLQVRSGRSLSRAGASITVTSLTDLVAFAISSSSALPALASFCAYASISVFFLWFFAATFFTGTLVLDERRQRDNRRECLCCVTRSKELEEDAESGYEEELVSKYFRKYHAPAILSTAGKLIIILVFGGLIGFGIYGTMNLAVEDTERQFIPSNSYVADYIDAADRFFPSQGIDLYITFEGSSKIYESRQALAELDSRLSGLSTRSPYIAEPVAQDVYRNVMSGLHGFLQANGTSAIGGVALGDDDWPTTEADFVAALTSYASFTGPGAIYASDLALASTDGGVVLEAFRVQSEYVRLTKESRGRTIDDADRQISAMDDTRKLIQSWTDLTPNFAYSSKFISIEGFKIIQKELFQNVGLAIASVAVILLFTIASPLTAFLVTVNVGMCIVEILGFMWALGIAIDSVSVINIVLAVGLSVDYSAHVGHCFMVKGGPDKNKRTTEALADVGASVLSGGLSTFLAVVVLLFSSSYVFVTLSRQFAITVALGLLHGLVLLPVMLSLFGPKAFASAEMEDDEFAAGKEVEKASAEPIGKTEHPNASSENSSSEEEPQQEQLRLEEGASDEEIEA